MARRVLLLLLAILPAHLQAGEIHAAVVSGDIKAVRDILDRTPVAVNELDGGAMRWTPLHYAADAGYTDIVTLLLARGADRFAVAMGAEEARTIWGEELDLALRVYAHKEPKTAGALARALSESTDQIEFRITAPKFRLDDPAKIPDPVERAALIKQAEKASVAKYFNLDPFEAARKGNHMAVLGALTNPPPVEVVITESAELEEYRNTLANSRDAIDVLRVSRRHLARYPNSSLRSRLERVIEESAEEAAKARSATRLDDVKLIGLGAENLALKSLAGKVVVIDVWATWCKPCPLQHPLYENVKRLFGVRDDLVWLSVSTDEDRAVVRPFLRDNNWAEPVYFSEGLLKRLEVTSVPTTIILNKEGTMFSKISGFYPAHFVQTLYERVHLALEQ